MLCPGRLYTHVSITADVYPWKDFSLQCSDPCKDYTSSFHPIIYSRQSTELYHWLLLSPYLIFFGTVHALYMCGLWPYSTYRVFDSHCIISNTFIYILFARLCTRWPRTIHQIKSIVLLLTSGVSFQYYLCTV